MFFSHVSLSAKSFSVTCLPVFSVARWYIFIPKLLIKVNFGGLGMKKLLYFCGHLEYFTAIWYIFGHLVNVVVIWYIFPVLVYFTKKNLATRMSTCHCGRIFELGGWSRQLVWIGCLISTVSASRRIADSAHWSRKVGEISNKLLYVLYSDSFTV
jgi:hypothetical protein